MKTETIYRWRQSRKETVSLMSSDAISRREFLGGSAAAGAILLLPGVLFAAQDGKQTFTILHTNDMHASFIGMGPARITRRLRSTTTRPGADMRAWPA